MFELPLLRSVLDCFEGGLCLLDERGALRCMNKAAEELTGYTQNELMGRCLLSDVEVEDGACDPTSQWKFGRFHRKDGAVLDAAFAQWRLVGDGDGSTLLKLRRRVGRRDLDLTVTEIKEKLDAIFDTVTDGLILIDEAGHIQLFNAGAERVFGYRRDEVFGQNVKLLMPSPFREAHDGYLASYLATGEKKIIGVGREVVARRKDGSVFPIYLSIGELWLDGRRLFVGVTHDLTERKKAEQRLLTLSFAVDQSPTAVLISNKAGVIEYVNNSFTRLTGYAASELIGRNSESDCARITPLAINMNTFGKRSRMGASGAAKSRIGKKTGKPIGRWKPSRRCATRAAKSRIIWRSSRTSPNRSATRKRLLKAKSVFAMWRK